MPRPLTGSYGGRTPAKGTETVATTTPLARSISASPSIPLVTAAPVPALPSVVSPVAPARPYSRRWGALVVPVVDVLAAAAGSVLVHVPGPLPGPALLVGLPVLWLVLLGTTDVLRAGAVLALTCWVVSTGPGPTVPLLRLVLMTLVLVAVALAVRRLRDARSARVVLVGDTAALDLATAELDRPGHRFELAGSVTAGSLDAPGGVVEPAVRAAADAVMVLPGSGLDAVTLRRLGWELERRGIELYVGTGLLDVCAARTSITRAGGLGLLQVRGATRHGPRRLLKAVGERVFAGFALVLLSPLLLTLALVVRGTSRGPALFRQTRVGLHGRSFTMLKLRTMTLGEDRPDAALAARNDAEGGVLFKLREDPRVTAAGRLLRRYSLDELPQLLNVLRGDMALIGPRPALPQEVARYAVDPRRRLAVRPGLTGLWQVSGRSDLSWEETVRLDLSYVDNWSLGLDLRIALRTVQAVIGHRGAY